MRVTQQGKQFRGALFSNMALSILLAATPQMGSGLEIAVDPCKDTHASTAGESCPPESSSDAAQAAPNVNAAPTETDATPQPPVTGAGLSLTPCPPAPRMRGSSPMASEIKRADGGCAESSATGARPIAGSIDMQPETPGADLSEPKERYSWVEGYINEAYVWGEVRVTRAGQVDGYVYRNGDRILVQGERQTNDQVVATDGNGNSIALKLLP